MPTECIALGMVSATVDIVIWVAQGLVAFAFLMAGLAKTVFYSRARANLAWSHSMPRSLVGSIGTLEILGALGIILPRATGILPWLTPVAAVGLALIMALAIPLHVRRRESQAVVMNVVLAGLAIAVALGTALA